MAPLVQEIAKQAQIAFSKRFTDESFPDSLSELVKLVNGLQASDLNINLDTDKYSEPITCILIDANEVFTMGMFVLEKGSKIPLHDHPEMHGVIKVIHGTVKVTTYSPVPNHHDETDVPEEIPIRRMSHPTDKLIPVQLHMSKNVTNKDEPVVTTPTVGNYHEMIVVEGPALMFDLIGPPYDTITRNIHYYSVLESKNSNSQIKTWLFEIKEV